MFDMELEKYLEKATEELKPSVRSYLKENLEQIVKFILIFKSSTVKKDKSGKSKVSEITGLQIEDSAYKNLVNFLKTKEEFKEFKINENSLRVYISSLAKENGIDLVNKKKVIKLKTVSQSVVINESEKPQTAKSRSLINEEKRTENVKVENTKSQVAQATHKEDLETFLKNIKLTEEEKNKIEVELNYFQTFKKAKIGSVVWDENDDIVLQVFQFLSNKTNQKCEIFKKNSYSISDLLLSRLTSYVKSDGSKFYSKCKTNNKDTTWWE